MKQTAIEWLIKEFNLESYQATCDFAKAMEKSQIINAHRDASLEAGFEHSADDWAKDYWDNNYKNKETWQK